MSLCFLLKSKFVHILRLVRQELLLPGPLDVDPELPLHPVRGPRPELVVETLVGGSLANEPTPQSRCRWYRTGTCPSWRTRLACRARCSWTCLFERLRFQASPSPLALSELVSTFPEAELELVLAPELGLVSILDSTSFPTSPVDQVVDLRSVISYCVWTIWLDYSRRESRSFSRLDFETQTDFRPQSTPQFCLEFYWM